MNKATLKKLLKMAEEVEDNSPCDVPDPDRIVSANVLFAAYVQEIAINKATVRELKATSRAYLLLMDEVKALSERVDALANEMKKCQ